MKFIKNIFLYFSAFIPLFLLLLVKLLVDIFNNNLSWNFLNTFNIALLGTMIVLGAVGILWNTVWNNTKIMSIKIETSKEITDQYFLQYFSLFVMFAIPLDISYFNEFFVYIIILIFIGVVYINCCLFYINPLLNILGYRIFDITYLDDFGQSKNVKIFCKDKIFSSKTYDVKIKNEHFAFVSKKQKSTKKYDF